MESSTTDFVRYFGPILDALRSLGGSATPREVASHVARQLKISEQEQSELLRSGETRFMTDLAWARTYLRFEGYIDSSKRGIWVLTASGRSVRLTHSEARAIYLKWRKRHQRARRRRRRGEDDTESSKLAEQEPVSHREALLTLLKSLPPAGFETLCQRLLRESGFASVIVTGRSGDGGIDGHGVLQLNPFVTYKVLFQCKRFKRVVGPSYVREFQGAIGGRADKGVIITTGSFSTQARIESMRDGAAPVELVDGQKLVDMFEQLELGVRQKSVYELDSSFFDAFKQT